MSDWLFGPGSMIWKVNRESVLLLGGRAALLMQLAHPLVAAGVAEHSDFQSDPFGRLRRTLDVMLTIIFGTKQEAAEMMRHVNAVHAEVRGTAEDGRAYSAHDPHLALWVFATLVYTSTAVYEACVRELVDDERTQLYDESKVVARMFGIPNSLIPATSDALAAWMDEIIASGEVVVTPLARELAAEIIRPIRLVPRRLAESTALIEIALLPKEIRDGYGLKAGLPTKAAVQVGRRAARTLLPLMPQPLRVLPQARAALRSSV
ncbi:MAG: oxygenase MpaB family protein [Actinomycetota bacterium]